MSQSYTDGAEEPMTRAQVLLLEFLREHDAVCPVCDYNLRALTVPVCPECGHELMLVVGATRPRLGWLLTAIAPGFFSGIAAVFLLVPIVGRLIVGDGRMSLTINVLDAFGLCSGAVALLLARRRLRFIAQPRGRQKLWALVIWLIHVAALALLILVGPRYI